MFSNRLTAVQYKEYFVKHPFQEHEAQIDDFFRNIELAEEKVFFKKPCI